MYSKYTIRGSYGLVEFTQLHQLIHVSSWFCFFAQYMEQACWEEVKKMILCQSKTGRNRTKAAVPSVKYQFLSHWPRFSLASKLSLPVGREWLLFLSPKFDVMSCHTSPGHVNTCPWATRPPCCLEMASHHAWHEANSESYHSL